VAEGFSDAAGAAGFGGSGDALAAGLTGALAPPPSAAGFCGSASPGALGGSFFSSAIRLQAVPVSPSSRSKALHSPTRKPLCQPWLPFNFDYLGEKEADLCSTGRMMNSTATLRPRGGSEIGPSETAAGANSVEPTNPGAPALQLPHRYLTHQGPQPIACLVQLRL
jgi:hypothetical protein